MKVEAVVEIPKGSKYKYESNNGVTLSVSRPLKKEIPYSYGYINETFHEGDGDPLDVCILGPNTIIPLVSVQLEVLGAFICTDNGESDDKILAKVLGEDIDKDEINNLIMDCRMYLSTYKTGFFVEKFIWPEEAYKIIQKDIEAYKNNPNRILRELVDHNAT